MPVKSSKKQSLTRRAPVQERAQEKVELILEAAIRIIDKDGLEGVTTNRIAEVAGISIGTLYQYFDDKAAIIHLLGRREMKSVTDKVRATLAAPTGGTALEPASVMIDSVFGAFGGRSKVHRVLLENALAQGRASNLDAAPNQIAGLLASSTLLRPDGQALRLSPEAAFVLTHAFTGVTRAAVGPLADELSREAIKHFLLLLIRSYLSATSGAQAKRSET